MEMNSIKNIYKSKKDRPNEGNLFMINESENFLVLLMYIGIPHPTTKDLQKKANWKPQLIAERIFEIEI